MSRLDILNMEEGIEEGMDSMYRRHMYNSPINSSVMSLEYPITPNDSPSQIDMLNQDLLDDNIDDLFDSISKIPIMEYSHEIPNRLYTYPAIDHGNILAMSTPYLLLEFVASLLLNVILCCNIFMFSLLRYRGSGGEKSDTIDFYVLSKVINIFCIGFVSYIFTSPDTYKSVNITLHYLAINSIAYEYKFINILQYIFIQLSSGLLAALITIGIYFSLISKIPTEILLSNIFTHDYSYALNYSFVLISIIMNFCLSSGLTILTNMTTSLNAQKRAIHKALVIFFVSSTFGVIIGPIGHIYQNLCLYIMIIVTRSDYALFNWNMFITYTLLILSILMFYPFIVIQIKFTWLNKYRRYIEYGR